MQDDIEEIDLWDLNVNQQAFPTNEDIQTDIKIIAKKINEIIKKINQTNACN